MKDLRLTKGILINGSYSINEFTHADSFCNNIRNKLKKLNMITGESYEYDVSDNLVYDMSNKSRLEEETIQGIMDLLLQLRAAQSDQNVFVQNNTVVRQQILDQLKREISNVQNNLTKTQVKQLKIVSNNLFDEDTLNELIRSLLEDTKKKLGYSWDNQLNNVVLREPETSVPLEMTVNSVKPVDVIRKYQTIFSNTINNFKDDRIFRRNNVINRTEIHDKEQYTNELVVRNIKQPIEITTDEFITKENLVENIEKVYNEKLLKRIDLIPYVTSRFLKTLELGGINNYKEIVSTVWDKVYLRKELPKTTVFKYNKVTDATQDTQVVQNSIDTYFNKVLTQDVTGLTLYKEIRSAYRNKKFKLKNVLLNKHDRQFIDTDVLNRYSNLTVSTNEKVYNNRLVTEANLINKTVEKVVNEKEKTVNKRTRSLYETEIEKAYKNSIYNTDVKNENRITKVKFENEFTNHIKNIAQKTAEIVSNNRLINRYDDIVESTVDHIYNEILQVDTNRINNKVLKKKEIKRRNNRVRNVSKLSVLREYEKQYQKSIFNVENLEERVLNSNIVNVIRNRFSNLETLSENKVQTVQNQNDILNRHNILVSNIIDNVNVDRQVDTTTLINKSDVENKKVIEQLKETNQINLTEVRNRFEKLYKNSVFNLDSKINDRVIDRINEKFSNNDIVELDNTLLRNVNKHHIRNKVKLINKLNVENVNVPQEKVLLNEVINRQLEKNLIKRRLFKTKNINNLEKNNLIQVINRKDIVNQNTQKLINQYQDRDIQRMVNKEVLVNRDVVNRLDLLERINRVQNIREKTLNQEVINQVSNRTYDKILNNLEKSNILDVRNYKDVLNENTYKIIDQYYDKDIERIVDKENLVNRKIVSQANILERINEIESINERIVNKELLNKTDNTTYNKSTNYLEKVFTRNLMQINEKKISEHLRQLKNKIVDNLTILNLVEDNTKVREKYNQAIEQKYRESIVIDNPLTVLENINKVYNIDKIISRKKVNVLPPEILQYKTSNINENNIYREVSENQLLHYNQMIEDVGRKFIVRDNETLNVDNILDTLHREDIVYKEPIKIRQDESILKPENEKKIVKQIEEKIAPVIKQVKEDSAKTTKRNDEKGITKKDVEKLIKSYISNINVDTISRIVINEVEGRMRLDRRRKGII